MISKAFEKGPAFIGYLTAGDGGLEYGLESALALEQGGVDLLEIGLPFSDPIGDGPVIQEAMTRALNEGMTPKKLLEFVRRFRARSTLPLVVMSYYNPLLIMGPQYVDALKQEGVDGILVVDLPWNENRKGFSNLERILMIAPSTSAQNKESIAKASEGFVYYACQKGTTGMRSALPEYFAPSVLEIKQHTTLPVVAGFGISSRETAAQVLQAADGFVVGSLFVNAMAQKCRPEQLAEIAHGVDPRKSR